MVKVSNNEFKALNSSFIDRVAYDDSHEITVFIRNIGYIYRFKTTLMANTMYELMREVNKEKGSLGSLYNYECKVYGELIGRVVGA